MLLCCTVNSRALANAAHGHETRAVAAVALCVKKIFLDTSSSKASAVTGKATRKTTAFGTCDIIINGQVTSLISL